MNLKDIILSREKNVEKIAHCMTPFLVHSGKDKAIEMLTVQYLPQEFGKTTGLER